MNDRVVWENSIQMLDDIWEARKARDQWREIADSLYNHLPWGTSDGAVEARRKYTEYQNIKEGNNEHLQL
jgi:hypothetical protein